MISGNNIETHGNECVEVKEGSSGNILEYNVCTYQQDSNSGCYTSRGDANTIRYIYVVTNIVLKVASSNPTFTIRGLAEIRVDTTDLQ